MNGTANDSTVLTVGSVTRARTAQVQPCPTTSPITDGDGDGEGEIAEHPAERHRRRGAGDRRSQDHQRGGVVEQALALQHRDDPAGHADPLDDGGRDGVGRADDRAERDAPGEAQPRDDRGEEHAEQHAR